MSSTNQNGEFQPRGLPGPISANHGTIVVIRLVILNISLSLSLSLTLSLSLWSHVGMGNDKVTVKIKRTICTVGMLSLRLATYYQGLCDKWWRGGLTWQSW